MACPKPHVAGQEIRHQGRVHRNVVEDCAVEQLDRVAARVIELDEAGDLAFRASSSVPAVTLMPVFSTSATSFASSRSSITSKPRAVIPLCEPGRRRCGPDSRPSGSTGFRSPARNRHQAEEIRPNTFHSRCTRTPAVIPVSAHPSGSPITVVKSWQPDASQPGGTRCANVPLIGKARRPGAARWHGDRACHPATGGHAPP